MPLPKSYLNVAEVESDTELIPAGRSPDKSPTPSATPSSKSRAPPVTTGAPSKLSKTGSWITPAAVTVSQSATSNVPSNSTPCEDCDPAFESTKPVPWKIVDWKFSTS